MRLRRNLEWQKNYELEALTILGLCPYFRPEDTSLFIDKVATAIKFENFKYGNIFMKLVPSS